MWVIPNVSSSGQCPAVNISAAWKLEIARANYGNDPDRYAVYAVFGRGGVATEDWVPLVEVLCSNGDQGLGLTRAQTEVEAILKALKQNTIILDMNSRS